MNQLIKIYYLENFKASKEGLLKKLQLTEEDIEIVVANPADIDFERRVELVELLRIEREFICKCLHLLQLQDYILTFGL